MKTTQSPTRASRTEHQTSIPGLVPASFSLLRMDYQEAQLSTFAYSEAPTAALRSPNSAQWLQAHGGLVTELGLLPLSVKLFSILGTYIATS